MRTVINIGQRSIDAAEEVKSKLLAEEQLSSATKQKQK